MSFTRLKYDLGLKKMENNESENPGNYNIKLQL